MAVLVSAADAVVLPRPARRIKVGPGICLAVGFLLLLIICAAFPRLLVDIAPNKQNLSASLTPPAWNRGGAWDHPLGTDTLGRDVLSRLVYGTRTSMGIALAGAALAAVIGVTVGLVAGYFGGIADRVIMTWSDVQQGLPAIIILLVLVLTLGSSPSVLFVALGFTFWMIYARVVRARVLTLRESSFIDSSRVIGNSHLRIMVRHVLPHLVSMVVSLFVLTVARLLLIESGLSFLSIGVQPPLVSWGLVLGDGRDLISVAYWMASFAGLVISLAVISFTVFSRWIVPVLDRAIETDGRP